MWFSQHTVPAASIVQFSFLLLRNLYNSLILLLFQHPAKNSRDEIAWINQVNVPLLTYRQDFEIFLPFIKNKRLYRRKLQWITSPMFPRYLFISITDLDRLPKIRSTRGVSSLVTFGVNVPAQIPFEVVNEIRSRCEDGVLVLDEPEFTEGDKVEVIAGPYQGLKAVFDRKTSDEQRVVILLEIMSTLAQVEVSRENLIVDEE